MGSKNNQTVQSFAVKSIIFAVIAVIMTCVIIGLYSFSKINGNMDDLVESKVLTSAESVSKFIDGDILKNFKSGEENTESYQNYLKICRQIQNAVGIKYLYIIGKDPEHPDNLLFLLDTDPDVKTVIGEEFDSIEPKELQPVFDGSNYVTPEPYQDSFGIFISGFAPIADSSGNIVAIIGTDYDITLLRQDVKSALIIYILICLAVIAAIIIIFIALNILFYNKIKTRLVSSLKDIKTLAETVEKSVSGFENQSIRLAEIADSSAAEIEGMSAAMDQTSSLINMTGGSTQKAVSYFTEASSELSDGAKKMNILIGSINVIENLSEEISKIINVINSIAKQTKILALNAEVEAARVGEAGKGFAVVAREVGQLAQNSEDAAKSTNEIVLKNIGSIKKAVSDTDEVNIMLESVNKKINNLLKITEEISLSGAEQSKGVDQVLKSISVIENSAGSNAEFSGDIRTSAGSLSVMTEKLLEHMESIQNVIGKNVKI